jgi:SAM-dependent methyltransferase
MSKNYDTIEVKNLFNKFLNEHFIKEEQMNFNIKTYTSLSTDSLKSLFNKILNERVKYGKILIDDKENKNYKLSYYKQLIENMVKIIINYKNKNELFVGVMNLLIHTITKLEKGHLLLEVIKPLCIANKDKINKNSVLGLASLKGTLPIFIFWKNFYDLDINSDENINIFVNSIHNSDDRLFIWFLNEIKKNNQEKFFNKSSTIEGMLRNILRSNIPDKFIMKRVRILSENCNLIPYFKSMITYSTFNILVLLMKYYYKKPLTFTELNECIEHCMSNYYNEDYKSLMGTFYENLLTKEEKNNFMFLLGLARDKCFYNLGNLDDYEINVNVINEIKNNYSYYEKIYFIINNDEESEISCECGKKCFHKCVSKLSKIGYFHNQSFYTEVNTTINCKPTFFILTKFHPTIYPIHIKLNRLLSFLRIISKKKIKSRGVDFQVKFSPVLKELTSFKPSNKPVLKNGSVNWQQNKCKFSLVPPRHLLPYEIKIYNNFLLREKADGIQTNNLPISIEPKFEEIILKQVKAEYIEELELYLIFDIDIPNTTVLERYEILRTNHPYTKNEKIEEITNLNELKNKIEKERHILNKFLEETKSQKVRWYPKVSFLVENANDEFKKSIIDEIIFNTESEINNFINEKGNYKCDGLILSPLSGNNSRDIKIKPKNFMTIDLLFDGTNWLDKDKNNYNSKIISKRKMNKNIYRCYPIIDEELMFEPREVRYDKKYPNNSEIINMIFKIIDFNWSEYLIDDCKYYQLLKPNKKLSRKIINELENQNENFIKQLTNLEPENGKSWLDLGCGKVKLFRHISKYNPKKYFGLDIDSNILAQKIHMMDEYDTIKLSPCDLRSNWMKNSKWHLINGTFDYIILNYSIMHLFDSDEFWKQLENVCKPNTKILFNVVSDDIIKENFILDDAYMKYKDNKISYFFPWSHKKEIEELFFDKNTIQKKILEKNYKIINISKNNESKLTSFYEWYIIKLNS